MRRNNILIPKPRSNFVSVECEQCGEKTIVFTHTTIDINCKSCGKLIAQKTGARAILFGKTISILDA